MCFTGGPEAPRGGARAQQKDLSPKISPDSGVQVVSVNRTSLRSIQRFMVLLGHQEGACYLCLFDCSDTNFEDIQIMKWKVCEVFALTSRIQSGIWALTVYNNWTEHPLPRFLTCSS